MSIHKETLNRIKIEKKRNHQKNTPAPKKNKQTNKQQQKKKYRISFYLLSISAIACGIISLLDKAYDTNIIFVMLGF